MQVKKDDANGWVVPTDWVDGLKFAFTDKGLDPEKLFQYRIIAINSVGSSVPGSPLTLVSKSNVHCISPQRAIVLVLLYVN